jgi:hypothetical protein
VNQPTQLSSTGTAHCAGFESGPGYLDAQALESESFRLLVREARIYRHPMLIVRETENGTATNDKVVISDRTGFSDVLCSSKAQNFPGGLSRDRLALARVHGIYHATIALTRAGNIRLDVNFRTFHFLLIQWYEELLPAGLEPTTGTYTLSGDFAFVDPTDVAPPPHLVPLHSRDEVDGQAHEHLHYAVNRYALL